ncbi:WYL domain-containing protein [bacterium]|nr:WYL domain-containing protein [bacterium]
MSEKQPAARASKAERIMNLVSFLLRQEEPVPISSIIGAVAGYDDGASRESLLRRFERDKQVLRDIGVPIEYEPPSAWGTEGYRIAKEAYYLGEVKLSRNAAGLLSAIFLASGRGPSGELSNDLRSAALKLGFEAGEDPAEALISPDEDPASGHHLDLKLGSNPQVGKNLETLIEAVLRQKRISMKYYTIHRDEVTSREVDPYGLGYAGQAWNKGAWYLVGHCHLRAAPRVFKVDRIRGGVKIVKDSVEREDFERPAGFLVRDHLNKARWEMRELAAALGGGPAKAEEAVVRFPAGIATAVRELVPSTEVVSENASSSTLRFRVQERRAFCRFLLPYVGQLEVVSPRDVESSLEELAREVLARYGKDRS